MSIGTDAMEMHPTILCRQLRQRVYLFRGLDPFATMTLDHVTAIYEGDSAKFVELELELNEINYTEGDSSSRMEMEKINDDIKGDILKQFPAIFQDQTPKYNKSAKLLHLKLPEDEVADAPQPDSPKGFVLLILGGLMVLVFTVLIWLKRKRAK